MEDLLGLKGKNIVIMGVANQRSLAWGVAKSLQKAEVNLIFTYRKERSMKKLERLLADEEIEAKLIVQCDVNEDESIQQAFAQIGEEVGTIHGVVHYLHLRTLKISTVILSIRQEMDLRLHKTRVHIP